MDDVDAFIADHVSAFNEGRLEDICDALALPCPFYFGEDLLVVSGCDGFENALRLFAAYLDQNGLERSDCQILEKKKHPNGGCRVTLCWFHQNATGETVIEIDLNWFLKHTSSGWRIAMIETGEIPHHLKEAARPRVKNQ